MVKKLEYPDGIKICTKCMEAKPLEMFGTRKSRAGQPRSSCNACLVSKSLEWNKKNKTKFLANCAVYYARNKNKILAKIDRDQRKVYSDQYRRANLDKDAASSSKKRAVKNNAVPIWANERYIKMFFEMAKEAQESSGGKFEVDHIVPLRSKYVCGFHCEDNLQVLPSATNRRKYNTSWPDMSEITPELIKMAKEFYAETR